MDTYNVFQGASAPERNGMNEYVITIETDFGTTFYESESLEEAREIALSHLDVFPHDYVRIDGPDATVRFVGPPRKRSDWEDVMENAWFF